MKKLLPLVCALTLLTASCTRYYVALTTEPIDLYPENIVADTVLGIPAGSALLVKGKIKEGKQLVRYHQNANWYWAPSSTLSLIPNFNPKTYLSGYAAYEASKQGVSTEIVGSGYDAAIHTGPRGGQYYINKNGKKTYVKKASSSGSIRHVGGRGSRGGRH